MNRCLYGIIWLIILVLGSFFFQYVPTAAEQYIFGYVIGIISFPFGYQFFNGSNKKD